MFTPKHFRYLQTANKHIGGPLLSNANDTMTRYLLNSVFGVLSRVIVNEQSYNNQLEALKNSAKTWLPHLKQLLPKNTESIAVLNQLSNSGDNNLPQLETCLTEIIKQLSSLNNPKSENLILQIVKQRHLHCQQIEQDYDALIADLSLQEKNIDAENGFSEASREKLIKLLQEQCGESDQLNIRDIKKNPGGYSKKTIFVYLENNICLPDEIVLRYDMAESPLGSTVATEWPLLNVLFNHGVKVPKPLTADLEGGVVDAPMIVVSKVSGEVIGDGAYLYETAGRENCALSLAQEMAKYHAIPVNELPDSVAGKTLTNTQVVKNELDSLMEKWQSCNVPSVIVDSSFSWAYSHLHFIAPQQSLMHGDIRLHNALVEGDKVKTILDWETAMVNNPGFDLAYAYDHVTELVSWQQFLDAYAKAGGTVPSADTLKFYLIRTGLFTVINMSKIEAGFLNGDFDDIGKAYASINFTQHCESLLAKTLFKVLANEPF